MPFTAAGRGTYILILHLDEPTTLGIGRLGSFAFQAGCYAYVGSALHSSGLQGRLKHHLGPVRRPHWHIDYLRQVAVVDQVWYQVGDSSVEHQWATRLAGLPGAVLPVPRFGASDCTCAAHLFYFAQIPDFEHFRGESQAVGRWSSVCE